MSQENVELVRMIFSAWRRQEVDLALSSMDDMIEWQMAEDEPDARTLRGRAEVRAMVEGWREAFDDFTTTPQEFIDAGEHVVVPIDFLARPRGAAGSVTINETQVFTIREGMVVRVREYRDHAEALKAVGLED